jgi:hypothetical protein
LIRRAVSAVSPLRLVSLTTNGLFRCGASRPRLVVNTVQRAEVRCPDDEESS